MNQWQLKSKKSVKYKHTNKIGVVIGRNLSNVLFEDTNIRIHLISTQTLLLLILQRVRFSIYCETSSTIEREVTSFLVNSFKHDQN